MRKIYWDLDNGVKKLNSDYEDIYFLLHVLYNAKTELYKLSAQGWINLYQQLLQENRYEDWIMKETCIIKDEELVTEYCRSDWRIKNG